MPATSPPAIAAATSIRVTTLIPFRNLFWAMNLGVLIRPENRARGRPPREPGDGLSPGNLGFGTESEYAGLPR
jgi:hypothetical protein